MQTGLRGLRGGRKEEQRREKKVNKGGGRDLSPSSKVMHRDRCVRCRAYSSRPFSSHQILRIQHLLPAMVHQKFDQGQVSVLCCIMEAGVQGLRQPGQRVKLPGQRRRPSAHDVKPCACTCACAWVRVVYTYTYISINRCSHNICLAHYAVASCLYDATSSLLVTPLRRYVQCCASIL